MSVIRVGSTTNYAAGWENVFGNDQKARKKPSRKRENSKKTLTRKAKKKTPAKKRKSKPKAKCTPSPKRGSNIDNRTRLKIIDTCHAVKVIF